MIDLADSPEIILDATVTRFIPTTLDAYTDGVYWLNNKHCKTLGERCAGRPRPRSAPSNLLQPLQQASFTEVRNVDSLPVDQGSRVLQPRKRTRFRAG